MGWLDKFLGMFSLDLGIDLGTANTLVAVQGKGVVISEPSVVAVRRGTKDVLMGGNAVGDMAKIMLGKNPGNISVIRPMKDGVIADFEITEAMLRYFIRKAHGRRGPFRPRVVIAVPSGINEVEKRAVTNSAMNAGARQVFLIPEPMAAAIGAGLPVAEPVGSMIVDIGGGTTEVAVISLAGIVASESLRVGGDELDQCIIKYLKNEYSVVVGENTAEVVKLTIGCASPLPEEQRMPIRGRDLRTGMPRAIEVTSSEVLEALRTPVASIINTVRMVLERTQPELASDLMEKGICMAGGTSQLRGLPQLLAQETGLPVRIAADPMTCVARGCAALLENLDVLQEILELGQDA
ncbi:MAG TPA: rod shape-determining protein [Planctomycetota bacterium]|nr:rod shape-determining protein [Planctomycetota bacterium]HYE06085.1 rod shape-determining protein [Planctomycetota bacterium]